MKRSVGTCSNDASYNCLEVAGKNSKDSFSLHP